MYVCMHVHCAWYVFMSCVVTKWAQTFITLILFYVFNGVTFLPHASLNKEIKSVFNLYQFSVRFFFSSLSRPLRILDLSPNVNGIFLILVGGASLNVLSLPFFRFIMKILNRTHL